MARGDELLGVLGVRVPGTANLYAGTVTAVVGQTVSFRPDDAPENLSWGPLPLPNGAQPPRIGDRILCASVGDERWVICTRPAVN